MTLLFSPILFHHADKCNGRIIFFSPPNILLIVLLSNERHVGNIEAGEREQERKREQICTHSKKYYIFKELKKKKRHKNRNDVRKGNSTNGLVHVFVAIAFSDCCQFQDKLFVYESFGLLIDTD